MTHYKAIILVSIFLSLSACASFQGKELDYSYVPTDIPNKSMNYSVYTPPGWTATEQLPLVLYLHGGGDDHRSFEKFGAHKVLDRGMNNGSIPRAILVSPDGDLSLWENWADGTRNYRDWVMRSVLPKVQNEYNTLPCPEHCHLMGISMGGHGAMRFALFEKGMFSSISVLSASIISKEQSQRAKRSVLMKLLFPVKRIFGENYEALHRKENFYTTWPNDPDLRKMRLQLIWGDNDTPRIRQANESFHQTLLKAGVDHEHFVYSGKHKWVSWLTQLNKSMSFLLSHQSNDP
ncbi:MAG: alpha/beta hydrolase [Arenicella sp.]